MDDNVHKTNLKIPYQILQVVFNASFLHMKVLPKAYTGISLLSILLVLVVQCFAFEFLLRPGLSYVVFSIKKRF